MTVQRLARLITDGDVDAVRTAVSSSSGLLSRTVERGGQGGWTPLHLALAEGQPDVGFRGGGSFQVPVGHTQLSGARAMAVDRAGRITLAGTAEASSAPRFLIARFKKDTNTDPSFGAGGGTLTRFPGSDGDVARAMAVGPDGSLVVVGSTDDGTTHRFALVKYAA